MEIIKTKINAEDARGYIRDILIGVNIDAITLLTQKAGAVRGNHFHKQSDQYLYVVSGKLMAAAQKDDGPIETAEIGEGDVAVNLAGEKHAFKAIENSILLSLTKGPRKGEDYEKDIFRLKEPIIR